MKGLKIIVGVVIIVGQATVASFAQAQVDLSGGWRPDTTKASRAPGRTGGRGGSAPDVFITTQQNEIVISYGSPESERRRSYKVETVPGTAGNLAGTRAKWEGNVFVVSTSSAVEGAIPHVVKWYREGAYLVREEYIPPMRSGLGQARVVKTYYVRKS